MGAFKASDYFAASSSVQSENQRAELIKVEAQSGDFDLRKFEVARSQFSI